MTGPPSCCGSDGMARPPRAKRSLGQNFLVDPNLQRKIAAAVAPQPDDEILEIGPGGRALTQHLAGQVRRLVLVELDDQLAAALETAYAADGSVDVIHADILDVPLESVSADPGNLKVIGNIPYNITTPILFSLLDRRPRPREIVLMVQREVADRIVAEPGGRSYGALAVGVQSVATAERLFDVGRQAFRPMPKVDSAVLRVTPHSPPALTLEEEGRLRRLTRTAFSKRRKQFQRILRDDYNLDPKEITTLEAKLGLDLRARPETLSAGQFIALANAIAEQQGGNG